MNRRTTLALLLALSPGATADPARPDAAAVEFFERKVRPVLAEQCFGCHAGKKVRGGLRMESRATLLRGGDTGPAVVPGDPAKSLLVQAVSYRDQLRMPPRSKLPDAQVADLAAWVKMGAPWPGGERPPPREEKLDLARGLTHWSFLPVRRPTPPAVRDGAWPRNPIDRFLLARLEGRGLAPAEPADRRTLLRRVTFDLTGLPPTPDEVRAFLDDRSPGAYERVVERLLASPAYGERWGRHWLDLVRFAETSGHEFDGDIPHAWLYRDYVIRAFNDDVPYDALVREHLAGDLMPSPRRHPAERTNESVLGTGFWFLGESKHSPVDLRGDGADRRDNMIDVFGKAFLGLTVACARCHDHKFDPITTREYYSLASFLQSSRMQRAFLDPPERIAAPAAKVAALRAEAAKLAIRLSAQALERRMAAAQEPAGSSRRDKPGASAGGHAVFEDFSRGNYGGWFVTGDAFGATPAGPADVEIDPASDRPVRRVLRGAHSGRVSGRLQGSLRSRTFTIPKRYILYRVRGDQARVNLILDGFQQIRDPIYGGLTFAVNSRVTRWHAQDVGMWVGLKGYVEVLDDGDGHVELERIVFSDSPGPPPDPAVSATRAKQLETVRAWRDGRPHDRDLLDAILRDDKPAGGGSPELKRLLAEVVALEAKLPTPRRGLAMADGDAVEERVHIRGNHKTLGEAVPPGLPAVVAGEGRQPGGRLAMARRLTAPDNPLLARVIVNRFWHHHFGAGLVRSTDDLGHQGDRPTHPELLDWLADELVRTGWSLKPLHRLMVLSGAYRMASQSDEASDRADPRNELLHRMPLRRLEAEAIRDAMLAVSGRLDRAMFGPGPSPHLTEFMVGRGRPSSSGPLDGDGRRSVYLNVRRNFLPPMFLAFDYPTPFTTIGRRGVSNVPAQALALLNNPFVTQQALRWAERGGGRANGERVVAMYERAYGREPSAAELQEALGFLREQGGDAQAWADLAHVLVNVKEFIFVN